MARARNLKPGFFKNELLCELPFESRLLFAGLWTLADREGRMENRPKRIRAELFPYDPKLNVEKMLQSLSDAGFIRTYEVDGEKYLVIPSWKRHQNPHCKEAPSLLPGPPETVNASPESEPVESSASIGKNSASTGLSDAEPGNSGTSRASSLFSESPISESPISESPTPLRLTRVESRHDISVNRNGMATVETEGEVWAEKLYAEHPKKKNKQLAEFEARKLHDRIDAAERVRVAAVHVAWCATPDWTKDNGRYAPPLDQWLADEGWTKIPREMENIESGPKPWQIL